MTESAIKTIGASKKNENGDDFLDQGATWLRWEPHIHTPGTVLNDQFKGENKLHEYLLAVEEASPVIKALGVTDYYCTERYKEVVKAKSEGRLKDCDLIFPNIEMRLEAATKGGFVNIHLLVNPKDKEHLDEVETFLGRLTFEARGETFSCAREHLIKLGRKIDPASASTDKRALEIGATQVKVSFQKLKEAFRGSEWAQENILVAVAGNSGDGTAGLSDAADTLTREEIERGADIIFASSPSQREFWLGRRNLNINQIEERYGSLKPCLHGCDAHTNAKVAKPDLDRYSWLKGKPIFDTLKQACIDPASRAYIASTPPMGAAPSRVLDSVEIDNTAWAINPRIKLNPGLVAIIGSRGSGKTALAEMIAVGCDAISNEASEENEKSFLKRAKSQLSDASIKVKWASAEGFETRPLDKLQDEESVTPAARYLSQQFVDELCSSDGMTDKLLKEVERVVFNAHDVNERDGTSDFDSLLRLKAGRPRMARKREEETLSDLCDQIGSEIDKRNLIGAIQKQVADKTLLITRYTADRASLVTKGSEEKVKLLEKLNTAAEVVRSKLRKSVAQEESLQSLRDEVRDVRQVQAPETLRTWRAMHTSAALAVEDWPLFLQDCKGDVDTVLTNAINKVGIEINLVKGNVKPRAGTEEISNDIDLSKLSLSELEEEIRILGEKVSEDKIVQNRYKDLSQKINQEQALLDNLNTKLADHKGAEQRLKELNKDRDECYERALTALLSEEAVLNNLYAPIMTKLQRSDGTLAKMAFAVRRNADTKAWATAGEELVDLRQGPIKGRGTLKAVADEMLKEAWETGSVTEIRAAMTKFRDEIVGELLERAKVPKSEKDRFQEWARRFAKWLYSTDHVKINYHVEYDETDIRKLSPGTRGIVLLLLYLALDDNDDSPLIIDQPEENLDPKSIYDELVPLFIAAKQRRQVIIVTHNANLVVNADADQIIIAKLEGRLPDGMPRISYMSGGLEEKYIRDEVCGILEGGQRAFKERARRLRVKL